ncbi:hypothetical protein GCM10027035_29430 [Emticicia sediminis]
MEEPFYDFKRIDQSLSFSFESRGKRNIEKRVIFQKLSIDNYYQLALVDVKQDGKFDDKIISNNGDRNKVLATVFQILNYFLTIYPNVIVLFAGSTDSRTRLYQIALSSEYEKASILFNISGFYNNSFETFVKNKTYEAFAISKK